MTSAADEEASQLAIVRDAIDRIDEQLGQLISQRAQCAQQVAEIKRQFAASGEPNFYRPEREAQILRRAKERNVGPLSDADVARLFREIMSACLALEQPIEVAFLGPLGTFTHQAALKHFGQGVKIKPLNAIDEIFREVEAGAVNFGVVPVENSTEGVVTHTLDSFAASNLKICGETVLPIHHNLMIGEQTIASNISRIYSHSQSLAQCRKWLDTNYPKAERIAVSSNAEAAKRMKGEWNAAAIAGEIAAQMYDLKIVAKNIEDLPDNSTRFLVIGNQECGPSGLDKTSILVSVKNEPGALYRILALINDSKVDMARIESRPSRNEPWQYIFFIDFIGHRADPGIPLMLEDIRSNACEMKVLGSYPVNIG